MDHLETRQGITTQITKRRRTGGAASSHSTGSIWSFNRIPAHRRSDQLRHAASLQSERAAENSAQNQAKKEEIRCAPAQHSCLPGPLTPSVLHQAHVLEASACCARLVP